jgi:hypothetical protein
MAIFSLKKGILQKNIPSFFTFWQKNSKIKNIASCRFESYFSGQSLAKNLPIIKTLQVRTFAQLVLGPSFQGHAPPIRGSYPVI